MNRHFDFPRTQRALDAAGFRVALLAGLFAWFLCEVVDLRLVFESRNILFLWNWRFFTDYLGRPGSLMDWVDGLLVQLCYHGWPAALVLAAAALALLILTVVFMNALAGGRVGGTWLVPGVGIFILYGGYYAHVSLLLGPILALAAALVWVRLPAGKFGLSVAVFAALALAVYYVAGEACCCFAACCLVNAALAKKSWRLALALALAGAAVKFGLDAALARLPLATHNFHLFTLDGISVDQRHAALFYGYFPFCAAVISFRQSAGNVARRWRRRFGALFSRKETRKSGRGKSRPPAVPAVAAGPRLNWHRRAGGTLLILALAWAAGCRSVDWNLKSFLEINYCADHQLWDQLLAKAAQLPAYSPYTSHDVDLALYHTGRLPYALFAYPQKQGAYGILFDQSQVGDRPLVMLKPCDLLLELGRVNEAEHLALEILEMRPTGAVLQRLALIKMIKGQPAAAEIFLNLLRDDLVWRRWAEDCLRQLKTQPDLAGNAEVQQIRRRMLPRDDLAEACNIGPGGELSNDYAVMLLDLLKHNPKNRMAYEYLMSIYLLQGNPQRVVDLIPLASNFSYPKPPPCYEEAALLFASGRPGELTENSSGIYFQGYRISDASAEKYRRVCARINQAGGSVEKAASDIAREMPDSYFAYYLTQLGAHHE